MLLEINKVVGLTELEEEQLKKLIAVWKTNKAKNRIKNQYYEGHITLGEVNLGIALPNGLSKLEIGCSWGSKAVDVLASRSMFDGFVSSNGENNSLLDEIMTNNKMVSEYMKACKDELKYGCTFVTLSADDELKCKIRFHSPLTAAALYDGIKGRIKCGFSIMDTAQDEDKIWRPQSLRYDTTDAVIILHHEKDIWIAERKPHRMGRPLMEALVWNPTTNKPFGRSRIKEPVRRLIQGYVRTIANATIGLEFATTPQKYMLGITDEQYDALINNKFKNYVGSMLLATKNPETGETPSFGQVSQGNIEPHVSMLRLLATQFGAATGLTVTDTGVVNDANPTSSDAILAQSQTLVLMAEELNVRNGEALKSIGQMAIAIAENKEPFELDENEKSIIAHFKNPAMPSVAVTADAAIKIATSRPAFADTDTYLEMIGFSQADIRRIKAQEQRVRGNKILIEEFTDEPGDKVIDGNNG